MCLGKNSETIGDFYFHRTKIKKTNSQKILSVIIDHKLNFKEHIKTIHCEKYRNLPNFLVCKFCGKEQFPHSFGQKQRRK